MYMMLMFGPGFVELFSLFCGLQVAPSSTGIVVDTCS